MIILIMNNYHAMSQIRKRTIKYQKEILNLSGVSAKFQIEDCIQKFTSSTEKSDLCKAFL